MTCRGEPAIYNEKDVRKDMGAKFSTKYTMNKEERDLHKKIGKQTPGPGF